MSGTGSASLGSFLKSRRISNVKDTPRVRLKHRRRRRRRARRRAASARRAPAAAAAPAAGGHPRRAPRARRQATRRPSSRSRCRRMPAARDRKRATRRRTARGRRRVVPSRAQARARTGGGRRGCAVLFPRPGEEPRGDWAGDARDRCRAAARDLEGVELLTSFSDIEIEDGEPEAEPATSTTQHFLSNGLETRVRTCKEEDAPCRPAKIMWTCRSGGALRLN